MQGLAGLPIGYVLAPKPLAAALRKQGAGHPESLGRLNLAAAGLRSPTRLRSRPPAIPLRGSALFGCEPWTSCACRVLKRWPTLSSSTRAVPRRRLPTRCLGVASTSAGRTRLSPIGLASRSVCLKRIGARRQRWERFLPGHPPLSGDLDERPRVNLLCLRSWEERFAFQRRMHLAGRYVHQMIRGMMLGFARRWVFPTTRENGRDDVVSFHTQRCPERGHRTFRRSVLAFVRVCLRGRGWDRFDDSL